MNNSSVSLLYNFTNSTDDNADRLKTYQYSLHFANTVICSLNLIGNLGILVLICQRRLLGRTTNVFVFSLAMADVVCCAGAIPYNIVIALEKSMSVYLCKSYFYALCISRTAVSYTVILLTTEKILNILHPSRFITAGRCMFFITLVWFFSTAYNIWTVVFYTIYDSEKVAHIEYFMDSSTILYGKTCFFSHRFRSMKRAFLSLDFIVLYVIPCFILGAEFCAILRKQHGTIKQRFETYYYIMRFIFFIVLVFVLCHTPFEIATLTKSGARKSTLHISLLYEISESVYYSRGVLYLIVYIYFKQYVCRRSKRLNASNNAQSRSRLYIELPLRAQCRGISMNELRVMK